LGRLSIGAGGAIYPISQPVTGVPYGGVSGSPVGPSTSETGPITALGKRRRHYVKQAQTNPQRRARRAKSETSWGLKGAAVPLFLNTSQDTQG